MKNHGWEDYEKAEARGPVALAIKVIIGLFIVLVPLSLALRACNWGNEVANVAQEQFGAREALRKYEWFRDAAAQLEKKQADMKVYDSRLRSLEAAYSDKPRGQWAREDREQWSIWQSEAAGVRASYNALAAEYNAASSKFNWRFAQGQPSLPRDFKPYEEQ